MKLFKYNKTPETEESKVNQLWERLQNVAKEIGSRFYGSMGTIHQSGEVNIELDGNEVVAVWFRCQPLPFTVSDRTDSNRANEMREMTKNLKCKISGVMIQDGI